MLRFCVQYCQLNAITKRDNYLKIRVDERIDFFPEATFLSILDAENNCSNKIEKTKDKRINV